MYSMSKVPPPTLGARSALAGFAAADLVQAFPLVGTLWGVCLFGEFRAASRHVYALLCAMYACFVSAVVLLACSAREGRAPANATRA